MKAAPPIGVTEITTPSDTEVIITRTFNAPRQLVWDAWTRPELIRQWMLGPDGWSMPICAMDLRPGGAWRYVWRREDGTEMAMVGEYREVTPPSRLVHTENWGGEWPETLNTLDLVEHGKTTTAVSTMKFPTKAARDAALKTGMESGVETSYARLDRLFASRSR